MKWLPWILNHLQEKVLPHASSEARINYLRRKGVKIGDNCRIDTLCFSTEPYLVEIGNHVAIAAGTQLITHDGSVRCFPGEVEGGIFGRIKVGDNVFIGTRCIILLNSKIGNNCIVGAGSIVRGQFPDNSVIFGNPAKVIMNTEMQKMLFRHNPGLVRTNNLTSEAAHKMIKEHFGITSAKVAHKAH